VRTTISSAFSVRRSNDSRRPGEDGSADADHVDLAVELTSWLPGVTI